eukprot:14256375-Alexandrium_andersonii.AAC.1
MLALMTVEPLWLREAGRATYRAELRGCCTRMWACEQTRTRTSSNPQLAIPCGCVQALGAPRVPVAIFSGLRS